MNWYTSEEIKEGVGAVIGGLLGRLIALSMKTARPSWVVLVCELPMAIGLGILGAGVADYLGLVGMQHLATSVAVAYTGPRALEIWIQTKLQDKVRRKTTTPP